MQQQDGTAGAPATLRVQASHTRFLREHFESVRSGVLGDLAEFPHRLRDPDATRARADTYGRILDGLERGEITVDPDVREALIENAAGADEGTGYAVAVAEHEAFAHLLRQLDPPADEPVRTARRLLRAVLEPPAFGGFIADLARQLGEPDAAIHMAAAALEDRGLATLRDGYLVATGPAMEFDALWPSKAREEVQ
jgi:hypothetical protein